jgi:hypothetical protein
VANLKKELREAQMERDILNYQHKKRIALSNHNKQNIAA